MPAVINMRGIEMAYERALVFFTFTFEIRDHAYGAALGSTCLIFYKIRCLSVVLKICKSFAIILSVISPYSVYVVSDKLC